MKLKNLFLFNRFKSVFLRELQKFHRNADYENTKERFLKIFAWK